MACKVLPLKNDQCCDNTCGKRESIFHILKSGTQSSQGEWTFGEASVQVCPRFPWSQWMRSTCGKTNIPIVSSLSAISNDILQIQLGFQQTFLPFACLILGVSLAVLVTLTEKILPYKLSSDQKAKRNIMLQKLALRREIEEQLPKLSLNQLQNMLNVKPVIESEWRQGNQYIYLQTCLTGSLTYIIVSYFCLFVCLLLKWVNIYLPPYKSH